ncbi:MFS transporter [Kytococcus sedentarius]|uniref:MFS transporter n=1 Tax=Kytococcus sedentarius TaxID=1276 RepID=UPI0035BC1263
MLLSAVGMFLLVFGIQEGQTYRWGTITGWVSVPLLIACGLAVLAAFVVWQARNSREPLVPLELFAHRNFSLANVAITTVGFATIATAFPFILYLQSVRGMTPTEAALVMAPSSVMTLLLARWAGRLVDRVHPRTLASIGMVGLALTYLLVALTVRPGTPLLVLLLPWFMLGAASSFVWSPLSVSATRTLPPHAIGSGSGVYNTTRQVGSVLGAAAIAAVMEGRMAARLGGMTGDAGGAPAGEAMVHTAGQVPPAVAEQMSVALREALFVPAGVLVVGAVAALLLVGHSDRN